MIIVTVKAKPKSDHKQDFINAFHAVSQLVYKEKGCIEYEIYQKNTNSSDIFLFERWESQEDLKAHLESDHMKDFFAMTKSWFNHEPEIKTYEVK